MSIIFRIIHRIRRSLNEVSENIRDLSCKVRPFPGKRSVPRCSDGPLAILIIDEMLPNPRFGAGYPRAADIVNVAIGNGWSVTVYPLIASKAELPAMRQAFGNKAEILEGRGERGLRRLIRTRLAQFDTVLVSRPDTMKAYVRQLDAAHMKSVPVHCVYDAEAIFSERERQRRGLFGPPMGDEEFALSLNAEVEVAEMADAVVTVTADAARIFADKLSVPAHVISRSIDVRLNTPSFSDRRDFLFVGRLTGPPELSPNVDSLIWFATEVMPRLDDVMGCDYRLIIAGLVEEDLKKRLESDRIVFRGVVDDLNPLYDQSKVFIAPTRFSGGIPIKIIDAAANGLPCVAHSEIINQLNFSAEQIVEAKDAFEFAERCSELYSQKGYWETIRAGALAVAASQFSPEAFATAVNAALLPPQQTR
ncbi:glycosyltransferase [Brevundimonas variabilis]|uniref:Glycosyltransferase involved in cell wall biosynthesis n=1 Tax=Brevundimonas variabilis TaxID=74312 RepID=A0A7W9CIW2_9CAUL|nr:glycosyltransferase [Brevundimonas variabilis]MBB5746299.1 glycosyltransferase involved in cell wall biosynthesis [Brevundimonas variabilis]